MWKAWATERDPDDVDKARIKIQDVNGNEVGGSSWLGGSIVKVSD